MKTILFSIYDLSCITSAPGCEVESRFLYTVLVCVNTEANKSISPRTTQKTCMWGVKLFWECRCFTKSIKVTAYADLVLRLQQAMQSQATVSRARKLSAAATPTSTICHAVSSAPGEVSSITVGAVSLVCSTLSSSEVVLSGLASISSSSLV